MSGLDSDTGLRELADRLPALLAGASAGVRVPADLLERARLRNRRRTARNVVVSVTSFAAAGATAAALLIGTAGQPGRVPGPSAPPVNQGTANQQHRDSRLHNRAGGQRGGQFLRPDQRPGR